MIVPTFISRVAPYTYVAVVIQHTGAYTKYYDVAGKAGDYFYGPDSWELLKMIERRYLETVWYVSKEEADMSVHIYHITPVSHTYIRTTRYKVLRPYPSLLPFSLFFVTFLFITLLLLLPLL